MHLSIANITLFIANPYVLVLIPIVVVIWYLFFREQIGYQIPNPLIKKHLRTPIYIRLLWIFRIILITILVTILSDPRIIFVQEKEEPIPHKIIIALDISRSMLGEDISPSRIEGAKHTIHTFLTKRKTEQIGIILFAGKAFLAVPFSDDYRGIEQFLSDVTVNYIRQGRAGLSGTAIGDAILLASSTLSGSTERTSIVLITDGKNNIGIDPRIAIGGLTKNITLYTIGIGGKPGTELSYRDENGKKNFFYDEAGNIIKNDIDETLLSDIAKSTNGVYFRAENIDRLESSINTLSSNLKQETHRVKNTVSLSLIPWLCIAFLICLGVSHFIGKRAFRIQSHKKMI